MTQVSHCPKVWIACNVSSDFSLVKSVLKRHELSQATYSVMGHSVLTDIGIVLPVQGLPIQPGAI